MAGNIRLFIVEEHLAVRRALATRLSRDPDIQVVGTASAPSVDRIRQSEADLVVLGLSTEYSRRNGHAVEAVNRISTEATVIVLTPYADEAERAALLDAGACQYLVKQIDSTTLIHVCKQIARDPVVGCLRTPATVG